MAQNEPQRKETPPGPSPNSPSLLFEYQRRSGKFIRLANRIESKLFSPESECSSASRTPWVKKQDTILLSVTSPNVYRFSKFSHCQIQSKFAIISYLKIQPRFHRVATLPCEKSIRHAQRVSAAKCRGRHHHSKTVSKYLSDEISST